MIRRLITNFIVLLSLLLLMLPLSHHARTSHVVQPTGKVHGTVMRSYDEAVIPNAEIVIEGENFKKTLSSDENGDYEVELPPGIYNLTANAPLFRPFRRAAFRIQPNTTTTININSMPMATHVFNPPLYYASFHIPDAPDPSMNLLVEFMKKRNRKQFIEYSNVTVSYDALTVIAGKTQLDKKTKQLEFRSDWRVIIDDGKKRIYAKVIRVKFRNGAPEVEIIR